MAGKIKQLTFSDGAAVTAPTDFGADASALVSYADDAAYVTAKGSAAVDGDTYYNTTLDVARVYANGAWTTIGSGGGGELNVVLNPNDANATWTASGAGVTVATSSTASDLPLSGIIATSIKITPVSGTDYVRYRWTMPNALEQRKLKIEWHQRPLSGYASGDFKVEVYKNAASDYSGAYTEFALSTDSSGTSAIPNQAGKYTTTFDADDGDYYELRIVRTAGTTALNLANVIVGPGIQPQGAVVGPSIAYTPSSALANATLISAQYERVGESAHIKIAWDYTGNPGVTFTAAQIVPPGLTIDESKMAGTAWVSVGTYTYDDAGTATFADALTYEKGGNLFYTHLSITPASGDSASLDIIVPIAEWAGSGTVNIAQNDVEYASNSTITDADDTTAFAYGPAGSVIPTVATSAVSTVQTKRVRFQTPIQSTDALAIEFQDQGTGPWVPLGSCDSYAPAYLIGTVGYGVGMMPVSGSSTDVDVFFYQGGRLGTGATYGTAGAAFPRNATDRYRVKKSSGGQAVGFGEVNPGTSAGLVSASGLKGVSTTGAAPAGYVGEVIAGSATAVSVGTSATAVTSFTLTPGDWDVHVVGVSAGGASAYVLMTVSTTSSTSESVATVTNGVAQTYMATNGGGGNGSVFFTISLAATTTYYLVGKANTSTSTFSGYLTARRRR